MTVTIKLEKGVFDTKAAALRAGSVPAGERSMIEMSVAFFDALHARVIQNKDTGRYARAWQVARNSAGLPPTPLIPLTESRRSKQQRSRLLKEAAKWSDRRRFWQQIVETRQRRFDETGWPSARKALRKAERTLDKVGDIEDRTIENLEALDAPPAEAAPAILIGPRKGKKSIRLTALSQVQTRFIGGTAQLFRAGTRWVLKGRNLEPHANLVERRYRHLARTISGAQGAGFSRIGREAYKSVLLDRIAAGEFDVSSN